MTPRSKHWLSTAALALAGLCCGGKATVPGGSGGSGGGGAGQAAHCDGGTPAQSFIAGTYFAVWEIAAPIETQLQLFIATRYEPSTGELVAQLTDADRNPNLDCGQACDPALEVCSPSLGGCVPPSTPASSEDDYAEYLPNGSAPEGYSATMRGCVYDDGGVARLVGEPFDIHVETPAVTLQAIDLGGTFSSVDGVMRGSGPLAGGELLLGGTPSGKLSGSHRERLLPEGQVPPGVPQPPGGG